MSVKFSLLAAYRKSLEYYGVTQALWISFPSYPKDLFCDFIQAVQSFTSFLL